MLDSDPDPICLVLWWEFLLAGVIVAGGIILAVGGATWLMGLLLRLAF